MLTKPYKLPKISIYKSLSQHMKLFDFFSMDMNKHLQAWLYDNN